MENKKCLKPPTSIIWNNHVSHEFPDSHPRHWGVPKSSPDAAWDPRPNGSHRPGPPPAMEIVTCWSFTMKNGGKPWKNARIHMNTTIYIYERCGFKQEIWIYTMDAAIKTWVFNIIEASRMMDLSTTNAGIHQQIWIISLPSNMILKWRWFTQIFRANVVSVQQNGDKTVSEATQEKANTRWRWSWNIRKDWDIAYPTRTWLAYLIINWGRIY